MIVLKKTFSFLFLSFGLLLLGCLGSRPASPTPSPSATPTPPAPPAAPSASAVTTSPTVAVEPSAAPSASPTAALAQVVAGKCFSGSDCFAKDGQCRTRLDPSQPGLAVSAAETCVCYLSACTPITTRTPTPTPTPTAEPTLVRYLSLQVKQIRSDSAELYWTSDANTTSSLKYGSQPGVWRTSFNLDGRGYDHFVALDHLQSNTTYYLQLSDCYKPPVCADTPVFNFTTPVSSDFSLPAGSVNLTALVTG